MAEILLIENNKELAAALRYNLELEGYTLEVAADGPSGIAAARAADPNLLILDIMLPGIDGYVVLETLRAEGFDAPVLILTARGEEADKVRGFRAGADQYLTKPFGLLELIERVHRLVRRPRPSAPAPRRQTIRFGEIEVDPAARVVRRRGEAVPLTPKAFDLLLALARRQGAVASRLELMREVWGHKAPILSRTVDAHIAELRRRLEDDPAAPRYILTVWKAGYRLAQ